GPKSKRYLTSMLPNPAGQKLSKRKTTLVLLAMLIALPVVLVLSILAVTWWSDKTNRTIVSSGVTRRYLLYVPPAYDPSKPTPLVISLHPAATWPALQMSLSRWNDLADQYGFIV